MGKKCASWSGEPGSPSQHLTFPHVMPVIFMSLICKTSKSVAQDFPVPAKPCILKRQACANTINCWLKSLFFWVSQKIFLLLFSRWALLKWALHPPSRNTLGLGLRAAQAQAGLRRKAYDGGQSYATSRDLLLVLTCPSPLPAGPWNASHSFFHLQRDGWQKQLSWGQGWACRGASLPIPSLLSAPC